MIALPITVSSIVVSLVGSAVARRAEARGIVRANGAVGYVTLGADQQAWLTSVANGVTTVTAGPHAGFLLSKVTASSDWDGSAAVIAIDIQNNFLEAKLQACATGLCWPAAWAALPAMPVGWRANSEMTAIVQGQGLNLFVHASNGAGQTQLWHLWQFFGFWQFWDQMGAGVPQNVRPLKPAIVMDPAGLQVFDLLPGAPQFVTTVHAAAWSAWANWAPPFPENLQLSPATTYFAGTQNEPADPGPRLMATGSATGTIFQSINGGAWGSMGAPQGTAGGSPIYSNDQNFGAYVVQLNGGLFWQNGFFGAGWIQVNGTFPLLGELSALDDGYLFYDTPADNVPKNGGFINNPELASGVVGIRTGGGIVFSVTPSGFRVPGGPDQFNNPTHTAMNGILQPVSAPPGTYGFYLKDVAGPVFAAANEDLVFNPDSSNKTIVHTYLYSGLANGIPPQQGNPASLPPKLTDAVPMWILGNNCAHNNVAGTRTIQSQDLFMLKQSSNNATNNLMRYFDNVGNLLVTGAVNENDFFQGLGAQFNQPPLFPEDCNESDTLFNFSQLFSAVMLRGLLSSPFDHNGTLAHWFQGLNNKNDGLPFSGEWNRIVDIVNAEAPLALAQTPNGLQSFEDQLAFAWKPGGSGKASTRVSVAEVPFCLARGADATLGLDGPAASSFIFKRRLFYSAFVNNPNGNVPDAQILDAVQGLDCLCPNGAMNCCDRDAEILRLQLRSALAHWLPCVQ